MHRVSRSVFLAVVGLGLASIAHQAAAQAARPTLNAELIPMDETLAEIRPATTAKCDPNAFGPTTRGIILSCNILTGHNMGYFQQRPSDSYYMALVVFSTEDFGPAINSVSTTLQMFEWQRATLKSDRLLLEIITQPADAKTAAACDLRPATLQHQAHEQWSSVSREQVL